MVFRNIGEMEDWVRRLSQSDFEDLESMVQDRRRQINLNYSCRIRLTQEEAQLCYAGEYIATIKSIKERVGCSLMVAKMVVDRERESYRIAIGG